MLCDIIDRHFNIFFVEIQLKKETLKNVFRAPDFGHPNRFTSLPNGLNTSRLADSRIFGQSFVLISAEVIHDLVKVMTFFVTNILQ